MSYWLIDPQLFLYVKGTGPDDVHLWRCKKMVSSSSSSSLVVPMKPDDFEYVETVKNHMELIGDMFDWDETDYSRLVKYIYEKRLLVNSQGFVIAELLHKLADKDGNKTIDDANEEDVPAIYIRSLDVLPLKPYIPSLRERRIPLRMVKYLGDVNGKAAPMEEDSTVTKLTARVDHLEAALATVQHELDQVKNGGKEVWMNDFTNSEWVSPESLINDQNVFPVFTIIEPPGTFTVDDHCTNVRAIYWCKVRLRTSDNFTNTAVCLEDLTSNKEKARFSPTRFRWTIKHQGKMYVISVGE